MDANNESVKQEETVQETKQDAPIQEQASETEVHEQLKGQMFKTRTSRKRIQPMAAMRKLRQMLKTADAAAEASAASDAAKLRLKHCSASWRSISSVCSAYKRITIISGAGPVRRRKTCISMLPLK